MTKTASRRAGAQLLWGRARLGALLSYAVAGALLIGAVAILGREITHHVDAVEAWIEGFGPRGVLVFIALFVVLSSLLLPDTLLGIIAGALFGLAGGTIAMGAGGLIAASLQHRLARRALRSRIERMLAARPTLLAIQQAVKRDELRLQVLLRLTPLNPAAVSYMLGAAGVRFGGFIVACLALIPSLFIEVYFGHAGKQLVRVASGGRRIALMQDAVLVGGLLVCVLVMFVVSRTARKAVQGTLA